MSENEVESIIGRRVFSGKVFYLVKWVNCPVGEASWECIKVLKQFKHLIKEYNERHKNRVGKLEDNATNGPNRRSKSRKGKSSKKKAGQHEIIPKHEHQAGSDKDNNQDKLYGQLEEKCDASTSHQEDKAEAPFPKLKILQGDPEAVYEEVKIEVKEEEGMTNAAVVTERPEVKRELQRIYSTGKTIEHLQYFAEYTNGDIQKYTSDELLEKHPKELIKFLEESVLGKLTRK